MVDVTGMSPGDVAGPEDAEDSECESNEELTS